MKNAVKFIKTTPNTLIHFTFGGTFQQNVTFAQATNQNLSLLVICVILFFACIGRTNPQSFKDHLFSFQYDASSPSNQIALIFPGYGRKVSNPEYLTVGGYYKSKGITPIYVDINWRKTGFRNLPMVAGQISAELMRSFPDSRIYIFGFSFGAVIAYKISEAISAEQILLCSMSPLFAEDREYQIFPFRQMTTLLTSHSTNNLSYAHNKGRCYFLLYGDHDSFLINQSIIEHRKTNFLCNTTKIAKNAGHDISKPAYLEVIKNIIDGNL